MKQKRRQHVINSIVGCDAVETDTTNENDSNEIPFHRVQNRARTRERERSERISKSPLKPVQNNNNSSSSTNNYLVHGHSQSHIAAHLKAGDDDFLKSRTNNKMNKTNNNVGRKNNDNRQVFIYVVYY
jgi:hypothetical protein